MYRLVVTAGSRASSQIDGKEENPEEESRLENDRAILRLQDLTAGCSKPCVVDTRWARTFSRRGQVVELRPDLAAKMVKLGAELTDEERRGITKLRYMQYREETSTTATPAGRSRRSSSRASQI